MTSSPLMIAVMSYGMGPLLRNCLQSVRRHAPYAPVVIFDDGSTDSETVPVLREAEGWCEVVRRDRSTSPATDRKTGGLHANMNLAFNLASSRGFSLLAYLQDDNQLVRPLDQSFLHETDTIWSTDPSIAQLRWMFMRDPRVDPSHSPDNWEMDASGLFYRMAGGGIGILDTGIVNVERVRDSGFQFVDGEGRNALRSKDMGLMSVQLANPVCGWLPWPPTFSQRLPLPKRILQHFTDRIYKVGFHPFRDMSPEEVRSMSGRSKHILPFHESFLRLKDPCTFLSVPWHYEHSYAYVFQRVKKVLGRRPPGIHTTPR